MKFLYIYDIFHSFNFYKDGVNIYLFNLKLKDNKINIYYFIHEMYSFLREAVEFGNIYRVKELLSAGERVDNDHEIIIYAIGQANVEIIKLLLEHNAPLELKDENFPLFFSCFREENYDCYENGLYVINYLENDPKNRDKKEQPDITIFLMLKIF